MFEEREKQHNNSALEIALDPFAIAAGLLRNDIPVLIPLLLVLALSSVLQGLFAPQGWAQLSGMMSLDRLLQLGVVSFIVLRWRRKLEHVKGSLGSPLVAVMRIVIAGFVVWGVLTLPVVGASLSTSSWVPSLCIFLFFAGVFWTFRFYFYFAIFGLLGGSLRDACAATLSLGRKDPMAAVRSLIAPIAVTALIVGMLSYPSPDGRSLFWATASSAAEGIFWILATYTGLAFALVLIEESSWRTAGLDPYRRERLRTLEAQGRSSRFNWLSPRSGIKVFLVALCIIIGNLIQGFSSAPAATIHVEKWEPKNHGVSVVLQLSDTHYHFRGFNPYAFSLKSQTGFPISTGLVKVSLTPAGEPLAGVLPKEPGPIHLYLEFASNKTEESLKRLDNMYLWYNLKALVPLTGEGSATQGAQAQGSQAQSTGLGE
jgi:hypothetical protein